MRIATALLLLAMGCAHTSRSSGEHPVALFNERWAVIEASLGERPLRLVVDTGANRTLIDVGAARAAGAAVKECMKVPGAMLGDLCRADLKGLEVEGRALNLDGVYAADMSGSELGEALEVDGLLGGDVLARFVVVFDYPHARFGLLEPERFTPPAVPPVPIELVNGAVWLSVKVAGRPARFLLDTGNGGRTIVLNVPEQEALIPPSGMLMPGVIRSGAGGSADATECRGNLEIGPVTFPNAPLFVAARASAEGSVMAKAGGIVGVGFLRYFRVTVDYPHRQLYLEQQVPFPSGASDATYGLVARPHRGELVVQSVGVKGPADAAGIRPGDKVLAIDGVPVGKNAAVMWPLLQPSSKNDRRTLALEGRTVTLNAVEVP